MRHGRPRGGLAPRAVLGLLLLAAPAAAASTALFAGYGPAAFGTRWEKALPMFPKAEPLDNAANLGSPNVGGPFVHRLLLRDQQVAGLAKPVQVELRFWKKKLWVVQVYWGENRTEDVLAMLNEQLGPSDSAAPNDPLWIKGDVQTTISPKQGWFGSTDLAISGDAQDWLKKLMTGQWREPSRAELDEMEDRTPVPGTPEPTPAGHVH